MMRYGNVQSEGVTPHVSPNLQDTVLALFEQWHAVAQRDQDRHGIDQYCDAEEILQGQSAIADMSSAALNETVGILKQVQHHDRLNGSFISALHNQTVGTVLSHQFNHHMIGYKLRKENTLILHPGSYVDTVGVAGQGTIINYARGIQFMATAAESGLQVSFYKISEMANHAKGGIQINQRGGKFASNAQGGIQIHRGQYLKSFGKEARDNTMINLGYTSTFAGAGLKLNDGNYSSIVGTPLVPVDGSQLSPAHAHAESLMDKVKRDIRRFGKTINSAQILPEDRIAAAETYDFAAFEKKLHTSIDTVREYVRGNLL